MPNLPSNIASHSRGLQSSSRLACLCKGGSNLQLCWHVGLWVSMFWIRWIHTACGPAQRHPFEAHSMRSRCCSLRAETSPVGCVPVMGPCSSSCQAGSRSMSGITDLPVSYGIMGGGWFLSQGSGNFSLLPRAMLEQLCADTPVTGSWGIHAQQAMEQSRPWILLAAAVA